MRKNYCYEGVNVCLGHYKGHLTYDEKELSENTIKFLSEMTQPELLYYCSHYCNTKIIFHEDKTFDFYVLQNFGSINDDEKSASQCGKYPSGNCELFYNKNDEIINDYFKTSIQTPNNYIKNLVLFTMKHNNTIFSAVIKDADKETDIEKEVKNQLKKFINIDIEYIGYETVYTM